MDERKENKLEESTAPDESPDTSETAEEKTLPKHPIAEATTSHILRVCDLRLTMLRLMRHAAQNILDEIKKCKKMLDDNMAILDVDSPEKVLAIKNVLYSQQKIDRIGRSQMIELLATGHFLTLFATFDAFIGDLLTAAHEKKPDLFNSIDRSMPISEMLTYSNVDDIKKIILASEIDSFRRKSYIDQFKTLENRFGLPLRKFENWAAFFECGQRRNLFAHCDGKVSDQYISLCKEQGVKIPDGLTVGAKLALSPDYLVTSCDLVTEVILKLGQTIWRKLFPEELEQADDHLISIQYDFLTQSHWKAAIMTGEFGVSLPKHSSTAKKIVLTINYIIALSRCNEVQGVHSKSG